MRTVLTEGLAKQRYMTRTLQPQRFVVHANTSTNRFTSNTSSVVQWLSRSLYTRKVPGSSPGRTKPYYTVLTKNTSQKSAENKDRQGCYKLLLLKNQRGNGKCILYNHKLSFLMRIWPPEPSTQIFSSVVQWLSRSLYEEKGPWFDAGQW